MSGDDEDEGEDEDEAVCYRSSVLSGISEDFITTYSATGSSSSLI